MGGYTRTVLKKMGLSAVLSKVVSQESDVKAVTGKVALGQADAGFVYVTDARPVASQVTVIRIPAWAQPRVRYEIAVVSKSDQKAAGAGLGEDAARQEGPEGAQGSRLHRATEGVEVDKLFRIALPVATAATLAFLLLPIAAVFLRVPPGELFDALGSDAAVDALKVTAETNAIALGLILVFGTPTAFWAASRRGGFRDVVVTAIELPLVLPPGRRGHRPPRRVREGGAARRDDRRARHRHRLHKGGRESSPSPSSPARSTCRTAIAAFEAVDETLPAAARTLGAGRGRVFFRVMLPLARGGLAAGAALAFARGIGEFGATIMFAGSLQGVTQTLSLAIYEQFDVDFNVALAISALLIAISAAILLSVKLLSRWRSGSSSSTLFATTSRP